MELLLATCKYVIKRKPKAMGRGSNLIQADFKDKKYSRSIFG